MDMHSEHLISHPDQVPVEIDRISRKQAPDHLYMGELAVNSEARIGVGTEVRLHMPTVDPDAKLCGRVIWLHERGDGFVLGISFHSHSEAFRMRMLEQLCHMAAFREQVAGEAGANDRDLGSAARHRTSERSSACTAAWTSL